jgi:NADH:ubiquinone oxidoreductase subunit E
MRDALNQNITEAETQYKEEISLKKHSKEGDKKYEEMIALAKAAVANGEVKDDSLQSIAKSLQLRMDSLALDVAAYQTLTTKTNDLSEAGWYCALVGELWP